MADAAGEPGWVLGDGWAGAEGLGSELAGPAGLPLGPALPLGAPGTTTGATMPADSTGAGSPPAAPAAGVAPGTTASPTAPAPCSPR
ncbi:hypothetical protein AB0K43_21800 [Kitasatospora sp. NPDC049258]|uniref:hypothetical protein n=1 Tax=Kitasatospora sp. NPDC049258 TaxID=3155394 RepID=UPI0034142B2A